MRSLGASLLLLALCATAATAQGRSSRPAWEDTVKVLEMARGQALVKADTAALSGMTADDFVEITRFGTLRTKAENLRDIASGRLKLTSVKYDSLNVRVYGDVAVLRGIADNTGTMGPMPFTGRIWYTRIFVRRDGRWQAVAMQHTPIP